MATKAKSTSKAKAAKEVKEVKPKVEEVKKEQVEVPESYDFKDMPEPDKKFTHNKEDYVEIAGSKYKLNYSEHKAVLVKGDLPAEELGPNDDDQADVQEETAKKVKKVWTNDRKELVSVEEIRQSVKTQDKKGKVIGGTEYFGIPLKSQIQK